MKYCPNHQRGFDGKVWQDVSLYSVQLALKYANAFSCISQVQMEDAACDVCNGAPHIPHEDGRKRSGGYRKGRRLISK